MTLQDPHLYDLYCVLSPDVRALLGSRPPEGRWEYQNYAVSAEEAQAIAWDLFLDGREPPIGCSSDGYDRYEYPRRLG